MDVLSRPDPRPGRYVYVPRDAGRILGDRRRRNAVVARRRKRFTRLLVASGATLALALFGGGRWWFAFLLTAVVLAGYVALLVRWKADARYAAEVVRELPDVARVREAAAMDEGELVAVGGGEPLYARVQVATRPDDPWEPRSGVRIRRWDE